MISSPLPGDRRVRTSSALIDLVRGASVLIEEMWETDPAAGSRAAEMMDGRTFRSTPFVDVSVFMAAATDQFRATATLIRVPESFSPSIAALTRSTIEVLGRASWLLAATDYQDFRHRMVAARAKELQLGEVRGIRVVRLASDGLVTDDAGLVEEARAELTDARGDGQELRVPGYTALATELMEVADVDNPRAVYSFLSGASHGEASTVAGLGVPDLTSGEGRSATYTFALTSQHARTYSWALTHCLDYVIETLVEMWGVGRFVERWDQTRARVWDALDRELTRPTDV